MERRKFLALIGLGAAGTAGSGAVWRAGTSESSPPPGVEKLVGTSTGHQRIVWSVETASPTVALTFDDGPDPDFTPQILDVLDDYGVKATFFSLGYNAQRHPELLREVVAAGHEVGSHGWRHLNLAETSPAETRIEIERGTDLVEEHAQVPVRVFRPPYGRFNEIAVRLLAERRQDMFVWSVTRGGLTWTEPHEVAAHIKRETAPGDIVDLHDGIGRGTFQREREFAKRLVQRRNVEIQALPQILEDAAESGLIFTTASKLAAKARPPRSAR